MFSITQAQSIQCPYCGEFVDLLIDATAGNQEYVEDCQVCCQPILMDVNIDDEGVAAISAAREND